MQLRHSDTGQCIFDPEPLRRLSDLFVQRCAETSDVLATDGAVPGPDVSQAHGGHLGHIEAVRVAADDFAEAAAALILRLADATRLEDAHLRHLRALSLWERVLRGFAPGMAYRRRHDRMRQDGAYQRLTRAIAVSDTVLHLLGKHQSALATQQARAVKTLAETEGAHEGAVLRLGALRSDDAALGDVIDRIAVQARAQASQTVELSARLAGLRERREATRAAIATLAPQPPALDRQADCWRTWAALLATQTEALNVLTAKLGADTRELAFLFDSLAQGLAAPPDRDLPACYLRAARSGGAAPGLDPDRIAQIRRALRDKSGSDRSFARHFPRARRA